MIYTVNWISWEAQLEFWYKSIWLPSIQYVFLINLGSLCTLNETTIAKSKLL